MYLQATDEQQLTPLHLACTYDQVGVVKVLLDSGANIRCSGEKLQTPLHKAAAVGSLEIVDLLIRKVIDVIGPNELRMVRQLMYNFEMFNFLLESTSLTDGHGRRLRQEHAPHAGHRVWERSCRGKTNFIWVKRQPY